MGRDVIIACDFNSKEEVINFLGKFKEEKPFVKIGMELFYAEGPEIVRTIKQMGHGIDQISRCHRICRLFYIPVFFFYSCIFQIGDSTDLAD